MAPTARRRVAVALLLRHAATFTYTRPARPSTRLRDAYLIDNEDVGGPLEPLSDYLLVKVDETAEKTSGGIMISDKAKEPPPTGVVQTVGPGALHPESGTVLPIDCKEGDNVMWGRYAGANVKYQRESHTLLKDRDVQMSWNGELTSASARPIGGNILIKVREEKGQTRVELTLDSNHQLPVPHGLSFPLDQRDIELKELRRLCATASGEQKAHLEAEIRKLEKGSESPTHRNGPKKNAALGRAAISRPAAIPNLPQERAALRHAPISCIV